jgi:hypothetical protein
MRASEEEEHGDPGAVEAGVVGGKVEGGPKPEREGSAASRSFDERAQAAAAVHTPDVKTAPAEPTDHVEVHHRDGSLEGHRGNLHIAA